MEEAFLHYIWQTQVFDKENLKTYDGINITILDTGYLNTNAGPDFFNAKIIMEDMEWVGNVEIHINSKDWFEHKHQDDYSYENVILHVVWNYDKPVLRNDGSEIPVIEIKHRVPSLLINNYRKLKESIDIIPCQKHIENVSKVKWLSMFDRALTARLKRKAGELKGLLVDNQFDWENTAWQLLANNFGFKINNEPFFRLANKLPFKILQKHSDNLLQLEALLFGMSGFLNSSFNDAYPNYLKREYHFLIHKYGLNQPLLHDHEWKLLRLRPANFPTIRLAQLAKLIHANKNFFSSFIEATDPKMLLNIFDITQSEYWRYHYFFDKKAKNTISGLGQPSREILVINTVVPLLAAYAIEKSMQVYMDKAIHILENIAPENNKITKKWKSMGFKLKNAFDSQASIELFNNYCGAKKCLSCDVGRTVIREH